MTRVDKLEKDAKELSLKVTVLVVENVATAIVVENIEQTNRTLNIRPPPTDMKDDSQITADVPSILNCLRSPKNKRGQGSRLRYGDAKLDISKVMTNVSDEDDLTEYDIEVDDNDRDTLNDGISLSQPSSNIIRMTRSNLTTKNPLVDLKGGHSMFRKGSIGKVRYGQPI